MFLVWPEGRYIGRFNMFYFVDVAAPDGQQQKICPRCISIKHFGPLCRNHSNHIIKSEAKCKWTVMLHGCIDDDFRQKLQESSRLECWQMSARKSIFDTQYNVEQAFEISAYRPLLDSQASAIILWAFA